MQAHIDSLYLFNKLARHKKEYDIFSYKLNKRCALLELLTVITVLN